jgi:cytochrome c oxidase cbb3-type subunit 3
MPAWDGVLSDEIIWDLVSYIKTVSDVASPQWGMTISAQTSTKEQVPAEFQQTTNPWHKMQPFGQGQRPVAHAPTDK